MYNGENSIVQRIVATILHSNLLIHTKKRGDKKWT